MKSRHHPIIYEYLKKYQEDPDSRVFAPLAEAYRKAGLVDEAIEIAKEGLLKHPHFVGGRVALARALFDQKKYEDVVDQLTQVTRDNPDNLVAQKLIAESSLMMGNTSDALGAYKMYLYFSPTDADVAKIVTELEANAYEKGSLVLRTDPTQADFHEQTAMDAISSDPARQQEDWVRRIEELQRMLQSIERYRNRVSRNAHG